MSGLQREVVKWIQSLDLTWQVKTPKWDLTNGYLIAEIFSWYFPQEIQMHMYNNGTSLDSKLRNWSLLKNFFKRHKLAIPEEYVEGTIHCKEGASRLLVERIYELLTNRQLRQTSDDGQPSFSDHEYQSTLPMHARSTATQAVKNNLRITELMADKNLILGQQKAQRIINNHIEYRQVERVADPLRFARKPTLGELAARRPPPLTKDATIDTEMTDYSGPAMEIQHGSLPQQAAPMQDDQYREVSVKQLGKSGVSSSAISAH